MGRLVKDDIDRFHDYGIHSPSRALYVGSESVNEDGDESGTDAIMAQRVIKNLHILDSASDSPITIIMNNIGGNVFHGMAIYDAIKACRSRIVIKATGHVMSMGSLILQAGDERILSPHAIMMIHHGYDSHDNHVKTIRSWVDFSEEYDEILNKIYLDKIRQKNPNFKNKQLDKMLDFDTLLTAQEAVDLGLADLIV